MPHPLDLLTDPISLSVFALYAAFVLCEWAFPARDLPRDNVWRLKGVGAFVLFFFISSYLPYLWADSFAKYQLFDLTSLGTIGGATVGILIYELGVYVWHRSLHTSNFLFRTFHRTHHSAERLDTFGAYYFSPMDMIGWTVLGSLTLTLIVGLSPAASVCVLIVTNFFSLFQHSNIKTPQWLGYFIQRPESHTLHHQRGVQMNNFADLPVYDMIFGTFKNPKRFEGEVGL